MPGSASTEKTQARRSSHLLTSQDIPWRVRVRVLVLWLLTMLLGIIILVAPSPSGGQVALQVGDVALADVTSPREVTYVSEILTKQRRDLAANAVPDVYDQPQARIGRQQLALASQILDFIGTVRSDGYADLRTKAGYLKAIVAVDLPAEEISRTLTMPAPAWKRVADEIQVVLEYSMRDKITESNLADERRKVPARIRLDLSDQDAAIVGTIVQDLLVPNSFFNAEKTEQERQLARDRVKPVTTTIERNEVILRAGDIVTDLDIEALDALGLRQRAWSWDEVRSAAGFVLLLGLVLLYYLWRQEPQLWLEWTQPVILASLVLIFLWAGKDAIPTKALLPYFFPFAALTVLLSILINLRVALVTTVLFVLTVGWLSNGNPELMTYAFCAALVGTLKLRRGERLSSFAWTAVYIAAVNLAVVVVFWSAKGKWDLFGLAEMAVAAIANSLITVTVVLAGIYLFGALFNLATPLQLMELARPTHPLLRQLLLKAPGTYHHTLIVGNMAERAAEVIGADVLLARVGAYYHDVGKTIRPYFFTENQSDGRSPHERLDPYTSAQIIIAHIKDGVDLARKYRLPQRVIDFIPEHQGTTLVSYFYHQAVEQAGSPDAVDETQFRYPGPKPQSRETAITMLADGAEATVRSKSPESIAEIEQIVAESVQHRLLSGELDECPLTLEDLRLIRQVFVDILRGLHHPRIAYPPETIEENYPQMPAQALQEENS